MTHRHPGDQGGGELNLAEGPIWFPFRRKGTHPHPPHSCLELGATHAVLRASSWLYTWGSLPGERRGTACGAGG